MKQIEEKSTGRGRERGEGVYACYVYQKRGDMCMLIVYESDLIAVKKNDKMGYENENGRGGRVGNDQLV